MHSEHKSLPPLRDATTGQGCLCLMQPRWSPWPLSPDPRVTKRLAFTWKPTFSHFLIFREIIALGWYLHTAIIPGPTMCRTEEEGVSGVDSAHVATAPSVPSKEGSCRPLPLGPPTRRPRPRRPLTGARRAALVTLLCAAAAAIGASRGWYGASWWTNIGKGKDESAVDLFNERLNISTSGVSVLCLEVCSYISGVYVRDTALSSVTYTTIANPILIWSGAAMTLFGQRSPEPVRGWCVGGGKEVHRSSLPSNALWLSGLNAMFVVPVTA